MKAHPRLFPAVAPAVANSILPTARQRVILGADERAFGFLFLPGQAPAPIPARGSARRMASGKASPHGLAPGFAPPIPPTPPAVELLFPIP
jgi:hypothetical protein